MKEVKILAPCGILGYGFPKQSFLNGLEQEPDAVVVDAGSTDAGPHKLGGGVGIVSEDACRKDLELIITEAAKRDIPVIIGSAAEPEAGFMCKGHWRSLLLSYISTIWRNFRLL